jgi:hypothetical protein
MVVETHGAKSRANRLIGSGEASPDRRDTMASSMTLHDFTRWRVVRLWREHDFKRGMVTEARFPERLQIGA